jgi:phospholipid/cholesterol/gamma-HCH transport system substrate-binding protein
MKVRLTLVIAAVAAVVAAVALWPVDRPQRRLTAHFTEALGVFVGSDVRVLGVRIGEVSAVVPEGRSVRVDLRYDARYDIPADAQAVIVPPSVVSDRYVQLTPAYTTGPVLADGADLPTSRTAAPLEIDDIYRSLDELTRALGPDGANADGALANLVAVARENLEGNGDALHSTLGGLSAAMSTVADGREDLFGTLGNLADLTSALAASDQQVREFNQRLADVAALLAAEGDDLAAAVATLATALGDIRAFIAENRDALVDNVAALADITNVLVRQQQALVEVLDVAPLAVNNLHLAYNASSGTLDTRDDVLGPYDPASFACSLMVNVVPVEQIPQTCFDLAQLLAGRGLPLTDELRGLIGQPPGGAAAPPGGADSGLIPGATGTVDGSVPGVTDTVDDTLGGILRGGS